MKYENDCTCVAEMEPRADFGIELPPGAGVEITVAKEVFKKVLALKSKKLLYKFFWSRSWSRNRKKYLRLCGAGAERNMFGSATLDCTVYNVHTGGGGGGL
jgi:hypothetical protein